LKDLLQNAGMAPWQRESLPLVFCGEALAVVPGIGVDVAFQTAAGTPGYEIGWRPAAP
jgi:tRNA(Ile)-lysidine synthase